MLELHFYCFKYFVKNIANFDKNEKLPIGKKTQYLVKSLRNPTTGSANSFLHNESLLINTLTQETK